MSKITLKYILDTLAVDCGEEYMKLHSGKQDFQLTDSRMNYYENEAIQQITKLFPATKIVKVLVPEPHPNSSDYDKGYNSGYVAGRRQSA